MRLSITKCAIGLALGAVIATAVSAIAAPKEYRSINDLPKGIQKQITEKGKTFNDNSKWGKVIDGFSSSSSSSSGGGFTGAAGTVAANVCSTDLDDEAMRICLGLPAVKKAVRVKKLQVELGSAQ